MTTVRCQACGASSPAKADWCSLCFTSLRPVVAAPEPAPTVAVTPAPAVLTGVPVPVPAAVPEDAGAPAPAAAVAAAPVTPPTTWPCATCGADVAIDRDVCDGCGSGFLAGALAHSSVRLPVVGDVATMSKTSRLVFGLMVALAGTVVFLGLATIGGKLL